MRDERLAMLGERRIHVARPDDAAARLLAPMRAATEKERIAADDGVRVHGVIERGVAVMHRALVSSVPKAPHVSLRSDRRNDVLRVIELVALDAERGVALQVLEPERARFGAREVDR